MDKATPTEPQAHDLEEHATPRKTFWRQQGGVLGAAWLGAVVAVTLFGSLGYLVLMLPRILTKGANVIPDFFWQAGLLAFRNGKLSLVIGGLLCLFAACVVGLLRFDGRKVWVASLIGGWTGFFTVPLLYSA